MALRWCVRIELFAFETFRVLVDDVIETLRRGHRLWSTTVDEQTLKKTSGFRVA